ncbi:MAG: hypothetical protein WDO68_10810 [Gammaproteobacteria bacterium]
MPDPKGISDDDAPRGGGQPESGPAPARPDASLSLQHAPAAIGLATLAGQLLFVNSTGRRLFGLDGDAAAESLQEALGTPGSSDLAFVDAVARDGGTHQTELMLKKEPGRSQRVLAKVARVDGEYGVPTWLAFAVLELADRRSGVRTVLEESDNVRAIQRMARLASWQIVIADGGDWMQSPMQWSAALFEARGVRRDLRNATLQNFLKPLTASHRAAFLDGMTRMVEQGGELETSYELKLPRSGSRVMLARATMLSDSRESSARRLYGVEMDYTSGIAGPSMPFQKAGILHALAEAIDGPVYAVDRKLRYTYFSPACALLVRQLYSMEPSLGEEAHFCTHPSKWRKVMNANMHRALGGQRVAQEFPAEGDASWQGQYYELTYAPVVTDIGVEGVIVFGMDISRWKQKR